MSVEYDEYLKKHMANVRKGYHWIKKSAPEILKKFDPPVDYEWHIFFHDDTKTIPCEYEPYDKYFYGGKAPTKKDTIEFEYAWLQHIHSNPHHWQHWILHCDDGRTLALDMPYGYVVEMICDWWSFSWDSGDLYEIFDWYNYNKKNIKLSRKTRKEVEEILDILYKKIEKVRGPRKKEK